MSKNWKSTRQMPVASIISMWAALIAWSLPITKKLQTAVPITRK